ncbi:MAG: sodium:alanine symporter family protein [Rubrobacter sp.]|nr:sodium:alanine symporter family protein [Rubrobacter sp.]
MEAISNVLDALSGIIWGPYVLVPLLLLTGVFLTIVLRGLQFRQLGPALHLALIQRKEEGADGDVSHYRALTTALAGTVGTGNIAGVATAIFIGGPGALFWMWITALFGMATKYGEAVLGVKYRETDRAGEKAGGPMFYLTNGIGGRTGRTLGVLFAVFAAIAAFGIGNMVQSFETTSAVEEAFGVPTLLTGAVLTIGAGAVILGGIRAIGRFTAYFVPFMAVAYMLAATIVLLVNIANVPGAIGQIFSGAFTGTAATGGFAGAALILALQSGVARGIFSNESGLGTGGIAAAAAQTTVPARQGIVSMTQTFIDTIVICSFTGLAIVASGVWTGEGDFGGSGARLTQAAFGESLGSLGPQLVAVGLALFAFSTLITWAYYGERNIVYLVGRGGVVPYRLVFIGVIFVGALAAGAETLVFALNPVWIFADVMNGLMALPNLIGLILLAGVIWRETREYFFRPGAEGRRSTSNRVR